MVMGNPSALAGFLLLLGVVSTPASAQTPGLVNGAYERLSAGNQKIARALFDAQAATAPAPASASSAAGSAPNARMLTLDEIAAQKQNGTAWGQVFSAMRSRGLLVEKNLGQVVSRYEQHRSDALAAAPRSKAAER
jgi:hypothetical protein